MLKIITISILITLLMPLTASAVGVSASPSRLTLETTVNQPSTVFITIKNPSDKVGIFDIYADEFRDWIAINPASFTLESGETKKVAVLVKPPQANNFSTQLSIVAKPLSAREFQANSGLKIPLQIAVKNVVKKNVWLSVTNGIYVVDFALILVLVIAAIRRSKRDHSSF